MHVAAAVAGGWVGGGMGCYYVLVALCDSFVMTNLVMISLVWCEHIICGKPSARLTFL
jgi:hypothetical protein